MARFLTNPVALVLTLFVLVALVGARAALDSPAGGGLSPALVGVSDWWRLQVETWHPLGTGTAVPAPPYVLPLALLATLLGGSPGAAVSAVLLLAVPFALWGAWRFLRVVGRLATPTGASRWVLLWGATTWALVPVATGAWGDGRLGVVVVAALLPWLAHAALGFADPEADRRWRAAWRTGLLLALASAFAPVLWVFAAGLGLVVLAAAFAIVRGAGRDRSVWGPPAVAVGLVPLLLGPWWIPAIQRGAAAALLLDVGRLPSPAVDGPTSASAGSATSARRGGSASCSPRSRCSPWCRARRGSRCWSAGWSPPSRPASPRCWAPSRSTSPRRPSTPASEPSWSCSRARSSWPRCSVRSARPAT